jgi:hypothetical protein|tara:strand:- start:74 stop:340 length:267 start_codon:yes stop_codon:yes gene_type:complete
MKRRCQRKLKTAKTDTGSVENDTAGYLNRKNKNQLTLKKTMKEILYFPFLFVWLTLSVAGAYAIYVLFSKIYLQHYEVYRFLYFGFGA